jgi:hypothetical protein
MIDHLEISADDLDDLRRAKALLENPGLAAKLSNLIGSPLEWGLKSLPEAWARAVQDAARKSLQRALDVAVRTLDDQPRKKSANLAHKVVAASNGAVAGAFGLAALALELPVTTTFILRSIAEIARSEGESVRALETKLACLEVFALGGKASGDDASETGYFVTRAVLARAVADAAKHIAERGLTQEGAPVLVRLIGTIAARFGVVVSQKVAVQAVPVIGAAGGAFVNTAFMDHFQNVAQGHFIVRRLERSYGFDAVRQAYGRLNA